MQTNRAILFFGFPVETGILLLYNKNMNTEMIRLDKDNMDTEVFRDALVRAGGLIRAGELVAFPTETVYGLGADALNADAAARIYAAKGRPSDNPLIVHIADFQKLRRIARGIDERAVKLAERFWPGPLTMIFEKTGCVPKGTTGGLDTVAVRMPNHPVALALIRAGGGFIAAPSANTSGRPSPTLAAHVAEDLDGRIPLILDGGPVQIGLESTIVDLSVPVASVLRPGAVTLPMLQEVIGEVRMDPGLVSGDASVHPKAPGMKYRHYAPKAELSIVEGPEAAVTRTINQLIGEQHEAGLRVGVIATQETADVYCADCVKTIGPRADEKTIAIHLYDVLREFDHEAVDVIYSESFAGTGLGGAIMNRLLKAAGHRVITV